MTEPIVITGVGALSPYGRDLAEMCGGALRPNDRFAMVKALDSAHFVSARLGRKLDRFAVLGLCAAGMALEDSALLASGIAPERLGIFVGNCLGGWGFTEPQLRRLHTEGVAAMSPFVATAWFPAAVQGQISLAHGIRGHSKTFSHDVGGVTAIGQAMRAIANGRISAAVCGATESLDSDYVRAVLTSGSDESFAEGAAFLTLERLDRALLRGAQIYAVLSGYSERFAGKEPAGHRQCAKPLPKDETVAIDCSGLGKMPSPFARMFALSGVLETVCTAWSLGRGGRAGVLDRPWSSAFGGAAIMATGRSGSAASLGIWRAARPSVKEETRCLQTHG